MSGLKSMSNDSMLKTFIVASALCLVCSIIVSGAATGLKPVQTLNKALDKQRNILQVAGLGDTSKTIEERFKSIETKVVDMATGEYVDSIDVAAFDQRKASKDPAQSISLSSEQDEAKIGSRAKYGKVYLLKEGDAVSKIIIPIKGYGLWSTMYGFVALESDANTISDVTFYEHNETPGLGGEIENRSWQKVWQGKKVYDAQSKPVFELAKGVVDDNTPNKEYKVDGLAGATLTSNGVTNSVRFWVGENGFGPYLKKMKASKAVSSISNSSDSLVSSNNSTMNVGGK